MKGMLTRPVTILQWSFVHDDLPHPETCFQIALALRDEVINLERADIAMIQVRRVFGMCYLVAVPEILLP